MLGDTAPLSIDEVAIFLRRSPDAHRFDRLACGAATSAFR
jgi:hypothetical protein